MVNTKYFRILIPTWRFFDKAATVPKLYVLTGQDWVSALEPERLKWYSFFVNPMGNFYHAVCNALDHLLRFPEDKDANRIVHRYVRFHLIERGSHSGERYQFKVMAINPQTGIEETVLMSHEDVL